MVTDSLSATEQSIFTISPAFKIILLPAIISTVAPFGTGISFTRCAVVFAVCDVCVVVLTICTVPVTEVVCTLARC